MIPTEDEAKDLIARGLWKNLLMMLIEEVITMIQTSEEKHEHPGTNLVLLLAQVQKLKEYLTMLGMYECFITAMRPRTCIFRRDMIYETLYNEELYDAEQKAEDPP